MPVFEFPPFDLPAGTDALRLEVRTFLDETVGELPALERARTWMGNSREFSRKLGERGFIAMTWPSDYGGHERSHAERYVVLEELLYAGAPVGLHWIADRQSGPLLLRVGTEEQRRTILPRIARGECYFCIGMSEPGAGSDLASVRTRGIRVDGGYMLSGQKIWTTNAHEADYMIALVRTGAESQRQAGLSQLIVDMKSKGVTVRPIETLTGERHFNEVFLDEVFVPDAMLVGREGDGWAQVNAELAFERSGPERYLSSLRVFLEFMRVTSEKPSEAERLLIGRMTAELWTLRQMSLSITGTLAVGENPAVAAAVVKDLGTTFEQDMPRAIQGLARADADLAEGEPFAQTLTYLLEASPSFSLRGGTREILRGIIARELGLR